MEVEGQHKHGEQFSGDNGNLLHRMVSSMNAGEGLARVPDLAQWPESEELLFK